MTTEQKPLSSNDVEITPEMLQAGVDRLVDCEGASAVYLATEVFQAMWACKERQTPAVSVLDDWRPIETAPKDNSWVLLFFSTAEPPYKIGFWSTSSQGWYDGESAGNPMTEFGSFPTLWAALQPPTR